ncbi:MAG: hypothetical protein O3B73_17780, partial [bacterium]|nr:hypothetical protein [bacterium]
MRRIFRKLGAGSWRPGFGRILGWMGRAMIVLCAGTGVVQAADTDRIQSLQDSFKVYVRQREDLQTTRTSLQVSTDSLASRVDFLKRSHGQGPASGVLAESLRQSLALTQALERLYRDEGAVVQTLRALETDLAEACDQEIDRLMGTLVERVDTQNVLRIQALRSLRRSLESRDGNQPETAVSIDVDDTPEEIRIKAELMTEVALETKRERNLVDRQLDRLRQEQRLRARVKSFASEFGLFDDATPRGRAVASQATGASLTPGGEEAGGQPDNGIAAILPPSESQEKALEFPVG